jgi:Flp pilus assembly CpaE family ATPase
MSLRLVTAADGAPWEAALVRVCNEDGGAQIERRCYDLADLAAAAAGGSADVAVVDGATRWLDADAVQQLRDGGLALVGIADDGEDGERRWRQLGVVHIARSSDPPGRLLELAQAAAAATRQTSAAGDQAADLAEVAALERLLEPETPHSDVDDGTLPPGEEPPGEPHRLVAVWGTSGAPGATTVAVNLAFEVAALGVQTLLVDANTYHPTVKQTLGFLEDATSLAIAARHANRGEFDTPRLWQMVRRAADDAPYVLPGLPRAALWTELQPAAWETMLNLFRQVFPVTMIDVATHLEEDEELSLDQVRFRRNAATRVTLEHADLVLAVARADPIGLVDLVNSYRELQEAGVHPDRLGVVVNQVRDGPLVGDAEPGIRDVLNRYLGIQPLAFIPYDRAALDATIRDGQALREARPGSTAQQALARLAAALFTPDLDRRPARAVRGRRGSRHRLSRSRT